MDITLKHPQGRLARWVTFIQQFQYKVSHVKGKDNVVPDAFSRYPYDVTHTGADKVIDQFPDLDGISPFVGTESDLIEAVHHPEIGALHIKEAKESKNVSFNETPQIIPNNRQVEEPTVCGIDIHNSLIEPHTWTTSATTAGKISAFPQDHDKLSHFLNVEQPSISVVSSSNQKQSRQEKLRTNLQAWARENWEHVDLSRGRIEHEQKADPQCRQVLSLLKFGKLPSNDSEARTLLLREEDYIIVDGLLYHIFTAHFPKPQAASAQLVIPQNLKEHFLKLHHDDPLGGHLGASRMISVMRPRYFWIGMIRDINKYVQTCKSCNASKSSNQNIRPPLIIRDPAPGPFHTMTIDTVGPLPRTRNGNKHLVCVTDQYSRYVIAWPSTDVTAKSIAEKFYEKVICVYGAPKRLLSDNGSAFISQLFQELCSTFKIKQSLCTAYHAMGQGQTERAQRSIVTLLRNFVSEKQTNWD